ncbi:MAG: GAF and ANTAR domain-containing protein [Rhodococcus sp. (in: high G+C Gram-positive bacteria)]|uniref:GAF domain-containing protein n=1 Tax=Rhodococcus sp. TaxID=1831 RepID=UPI003BAFB35C
MPEKSGSVVGIESIAPAVEALRQLLEDDAPTRVTLQRLCEWSVETFNGADMAGALLLSDDDHARTVACTGVRVGHTDEIQRRTGEGPSLEAVTARQVVRAHSADVPARWPSFFAASAHTRVRSFLCAPIAVGNHHGSLNLYSYHGTAFSSVDAALLRVFTAMVDPSTRLARDGREARAELAGLTKAMESRSVIEQATGIVMAAGVIAAEEAFQFLIATLAAQKRRTRSNPTGTRRYHCRGGWGGWGGTGRGQRTHPREQDGETEDRPADQRRQSDHGER